MIFPPISISYKPNHRFLCLNGTLIWYFLYWCYIFSCPGETIFHIFLNQTEHWLKESNYFRILFWKQYDTNKESKMGIKSKKLCRVWCCFKLSRGNVFSRNIKTMFFWSLSVFTYQFCLLNQFQTINAWAKMSQILTF